MKLTSVELHPAGSTEVGVLSFRDPGRSNPFNVIGITGLDADSIIPRYYGGPGFYNLVLEKRDVVVRIGLNPRFDLGQSFSGLRDEVYRMIASSRTGLLAVHFKNLATTVATLSGFVTKVEAPQFEKQQEVQITISCDDPVLRAPADTVINVAGLNPGSTTIQDDASTAPHGFKFAMSFQAARATLTMSDPDNPTWSFSISPTGGFANGDVLYFSSEVNNKYLYYMRGAAKTFLADKIVPGSIWPVLFPKTNKLAVATPAQTTWVAISHRPAYWGV